MGKKQTTSKDAMTIETIVVLAKLSSGQVHQVVLKQNETEAVLNLISLLSNSKQPPGVRIMETPIEGLDIELPKKEK
jgi:hypothetical protein